MENMKIVINSAPRSGHAWLQMVLHSATEYNRDINMGDPDGNGFIIRTNTPVMLLAKFEDIKQTIILRDPFDLIPSIITKTVGGLGNTITSGIPMPHEMGKLPPLDRLILDQVDVYKRYAYGIKNNINNLYPYLFEEVTENISYVVKDLTGIEVSNDRIPELISESEIRIRRVNLNDPGYNNAVPINKKPDIYYQLKEMVLESKRTDEVLDIYLDCKNAILENRNNA
jgi:hypothetical protein